VLFSFVPLAAIISLSKVKSWEEVGYWQCRLAWLTTEGSCAAYRGVSGRGESKLAQMQVLSDDIKNQKNSEVGSILPQCC